MIEPQFHMRAWRIKIYRKGSVTTVEYDRVKHAFWMANDTVLCIARYAEDGSHYYTHWPREELAWFTVERERAAWPAA